MQTYQSYVICDGLVGTDYGPTGNAFNGVVKDVQLSIADDKGEHMVSPEEAIRLAMARQCSGPGGT